MIGVRHRLRATVLAALFMVAAAALLPAGSGAAQAAPSLTVKSDGGLTPLPAPKTPPKKLNHAKLLVKANKKAGNAGVASAAYIACFVEVSNAYLTPVSTVGVDVIVYCVDDIGFYAPVDAIGVSLTIFESNQPVRAASGAVYYSPFFGGTLTTTFCQPGAYYYGEAFVEVIFPPGYDPRYDYGAFGSPVSIPVC